MKCAVFASGGGSNFQALLDHRRSGELHVDFVVVIGNNSSAPVLERARNGAIPAVHLAPSHYAEPAQYVRALDGLLEQYGVECIVLAGYMKKIPTEIVRRFHNRIINIHPALLPSFGGQGLYGEKVHEAVLAYGAKVSGVTVHFVDEEYDHGPVIFQDTVPVLDTDTPHTLAQRVLALEHTSYWKALEMVASGKISVEGRRVIAAR